MALNLCFWHFNIERSLLFESYNFLKTCNHKKRRIRKEEIKDEFWVFLLWTIIIPFKIKLFHSFCSFSTLDFSLYHCLAKWDYGNMEQKSKGLVQKCFIYSAMQHQTCDCIWSQVYYQIWQVHPILIKDSSKCAMTTKIDFLPDKLESPPSFRIKFIPPNLNFQQILLKRWQGLF